MPIATVMTNARVLLRGVAMAALVSSASACASAGPAASRPRAFPRAPDHAVAIPAPLDATEGEAFGSSIAMTALSLQGITYRFGGEDPVTGLDCSGLVLYVFGRHHVAMPRTVEEQFAIGDEVDPSAIEAGDLVFFTTIGPGATHVGVALGPDRPGEFVHAPGTGSVVRIDRYDSSYWRRRIVGVRRVVTAR